MDITITVVITTYNRASLLSEAIKSVLNQTFSDFELIIVDDRSSDETPDVVASFQDSRIRYIRHEQNKGLAASRNTGLQYARGKYIAFLDDDDEWGPEKLALQLDAMEKSEYHPCLVYTGKQSGWMEDYIFKGFTMGSSCMLIPTRKLAEIGGHSENLESCIDHDLWMKMAQAKFYMTPVPSTSLVKREREAKQISRMTNSLKKRFRGIEQFFNKWKPYVIQYYGVSSWQKIEAIYQRQTFNQIQKQYLKGQLSKKEALEYYKRCMQWQTQWFIQNYFALWLNYLSFSLGFIEYLPFKNNKRKLVTDLFSFNLKIK
jgi:glycosyltransferase involved in cell wall biosynthesis